LKVNGEAWNTLTLPHALLAKGATLDFVMGPEPSKWGTGPDALPASITAEGQKPAPLRDVTRAEGTTLDGHRDAKLAAVSDNDSSTEFALAKGKTVVDYRLAQAANVEVYTITSGAAKPAPSHWTLQGSADGKQWTTLDERHDERFPWHRQTRAFALKQPASYKRYRLVLESDAASSVAELELLAR
jgi:hypothetical protein